MGTKRIPPGLSIWVLVFFLGHIPSRPSLNVFAWLDYVFEISSCLLLPWIEDREGCVNVKKVACLRKIWVTSTAPPTFACAPAHYWPMPSLRRWSWRDWGPRTEKNSPLLLQYLHLGLRKRIRFGTLPKSFSLLPFHLFFCSCQETDSYNR